jgi:hypothetical protein
MAFWNCECQVCNSIVVRPSRDFRKDRLTTFCRNCQWKVRFKGFGELPLTQWSRIVKGAQDRGLPIEITIEDAWQKFLDQDRRCYLTGLELAFSRRRDTKVSNASLDRINNTLGYTKENSAWCHKTVNIMKGTMSVDELKKWAKLISEKEPNVTEIIE